MNINFLITGLIIGFAIAAPVGPIAVLCIRRTLANGNLNGFFSGLGAATADMFYGAVAAFGLTAIQTFYSSWQFWLQLIGGLFLFYLGIQTFISKPAETTPQVNETHDGLLAAYLSTVFLTLTNPATIISFTVIFAGLGYGKTGGNYTSASFLVLGVLIGSTTWWLTLSSVVGFFRERFTSRLMIWVNRIAGVVIFAFGIISFVTAFH
jgi:threonine/homoserine/homoserine lactone efflux protein